MAKIILSILLILYSTVPCYSYQEFDIVKDDVSSFILLKPSTFQDMSRDIKLGDNLKKKLDSYQSLVKSQSSEITILKDNESILNEKESIYSKELDLYKSHSSSLEELYAGEVKENARLRMDRPCLVCWTIGGVVIGISGVYLAALVLNNIK